MRNMSAIHWGSGCEYSLVIQVMPYADASIGGSVDPGQDNDERSIGTFFSRGRRTGNLVSP